MTPINTKPIAFLFAYVPKMPRSIDELDQVKALRAQSAILLTFAQASGLEPPIRRPAITTYRSALFTRNAVFRRTVAEAKAASTTLWLADIAQLLRTTKSANAAKVMEDLDKLELDLVDCMSGKKWREFSAQERLMLMQEAFSRKMSSAATVSNRTSQAPNIQNARRGALANRASADRQAKQLRPIVVDFKATLGPGEPLTPARLMRHLNQQGVKPARGTLWSYNGCKNLLNRIQLDSE